MEGDPERRRAERNAKWHIRRVNVDCRVGRLLPVFIGEVGRGELRVFGDARVGGAGVDAVFLRRSRLARAGCVKAGYGNASHSDFRWASVDRKSTRLNSS